MDFVHIRLISKIVFRLSYLSFSSHSHQRRESAQFNVNRYNLFGGKEENLPAVMFYEKVGNGNFRPINAMTLVPGRMLLTNNPDVNDAAVISQQNARKLMLALEGRHTDRRIEDLK